MYKFVFGVLFLVFILQVSVSADGQSMYEILLITKSHISRIEENRNRKFYSLKIHYMQSYNQQCFQITNRTNKHQYNKTTT